LSVEDVAKRLNVDPRNGLSASEAAQRLQSNGPNQLAEVAKEPRWQAFLRQYKDFMQIVLLGAAVLSVLIGEVSSGVLLVLLTVLNAVLGLRQESKAEDSMNALKQMMTVTTRVRRDGQVMEIPAEEVVTGDIVLFEAGDLVPADGRLLVAATLEIEESALTGESTPASKQTATVDNPDAVVGDRTDMGHMQSSVTRGRGEMLVTATGMDTEVGHIAGMLQATEQEKSPLTKQIDQLTLVIAGLAGFALVAIVILGLKNGDPLAEIFNTGIALAIAAIPTGLPVVITTVLSIGTMQLAKHNAIVKSLPAVETLGSTSAINSDKTGTLTLNQMTARQLTIAGNRFAVTGEGYSTDGQIKHVGGQGHDSLDPMLLPMALASDAVVRDGELVGDPTEGALVVLAEKGGVLVDMTREAYPRIAEVPFDSEYKFMATFHNFEKKNGEQVVRCYVKGAPDVLIARSTYGRGRDGVPVKMTDELVQRTLDENERMASEGMRVMVVAERDFDPATFDADGDLLPLVDDLTLLAMAGIVDPPRPEAKTAIAAAHDAGIQVRMITGDHAVTAAAIGRELGIEGRAITGAEFEKMSDEEVDAQIDEIGVIARVAPEHKVRLVRALQAKNRIVAMTGDGVNDAPALKAANIGVAMGITGTEVSKGAASMILTDDNFATIVTAVDQGRVIYDNLMKFIRFQMGTLTGFILAFLGSALFNIAGTALFTAVQILWINFLIDAPIGIALGRDTATPGLMKQKPRAADEKIMTRSLAIRLTVLGLYMAFITLWAYTWAEGASGSKATAQTMAFVTFSLIQIPMALNLRYPTDTVFSLNTISNPKLLMAFGWVLLTTVLVTEIGLFQRMADTTSLSGNQWFMAIALAVSLLVIGEIFKLIYRFVKRD